MGRSLVLMTGVLKALPMNKVHVLTYPFKQKMTKLRQSSLLNVAIFASTYAGLLGGWLFQTPWGLATLTQPSIETAVLTARPRVYVSTHSKPGCSKVNVFIPAYNRALAIDLA